MADHLKRRRRRSARVALEPRSDRRARLPLYAREFHPGTEDQVRFANVRPLEPGSAWSLIALVCPSAMTTGGIVHQRDNTPTGNTAFALGLQDGALCVAAGRQSFTCRAALAAGTWSFVGVTASNVGTRIYLATQDSVKVEEGPPLPAGPCAADTPLVIGHLADSFPGSIALVCLYAEDLPDETMRAICASRVDSNFAPQLCFSWQAPNGASDIDLVTRRVASVSGTRIVPFTFAAQPPVFAAPPPKIDAPAPSLPPPPPIASPPIAPPPREEKTTPKRSSLFEQLGLVSKDDI